MSVVNLNRFRKRKAREEAKKKADANARRHGQTKAERTRQRAERRRLEEAVDGAHLEESPDDPASNEDEDR
jgi:hypothetical protein